MKLLIAFALLALASFGFATITACQNVSASDTLGQNISSTGTTCINITAANVVLDCAGFSITGSNASGTYGIRSTGANTTVKNCSIGNFEAGIGFAATGAIAFNNTITGTYPVVSTPFGSGIYYSSTNSLTYDNYINMSGIGVMFTGGNNHIVENNTIQGTSYGAFNIYQSGLNISNNKVYAVGATAKGFFTQGGGGGNRLINNSIFLKGTTSKGYSTDNTASGRGDMIDCKGAVIQGTNTSNQVGIEIGSYNTTIQNCVLNETGTGVKYGGGVALTGNILLNSTFLSTITGANGQGSVYMAAPANITGNTFHRTGEYMGIWLDPGSNNTRLSNNVYNLSGPLYGAIYITSGQTVFATNETIMLKPTGSYGVYFATVDGSTLDCEGGVIYGNNTTSTYGVATSRLRTTIMNCDIRNFSTGVGLISASNTTVQNNTISSTAASANGGYGIYIRSTASKNVTITNNRITMAGTGFGFYETNGAQTGTFTNNVVTVPSTGLNFVLEGSGGAWNISNNSFIGAGVYPYAGNNLIFNNTFQGTGAWTAHVNGDGHNYIYDNWISSTSDTTMSLRSTDLYRNTLINQSYAFATVGDGINFYNNTHNGSLTAGGNTWSGYANVTNNQFNSFYRWTVSTTNGSFTDNNLTADLPFILTGTGGAATTVQFANNRINTTGANIAIYFTSNMGYQFINNTFTGTQAILGEVGTVGANLTFINNTLRMTGTAFSLKNLNTNNTFTGNNITAPVWFNVVNGNNAFNSTLFGNSYYNTSGTSAYVINGSVWTDGDTNGYADGAGDFLNATNFATQWIGSGTDFHPGWITSTPPAGNSCAYVSGNWIIQLADLCNITTSNYLPANNITFNGTGWARFGNASLNPQVITVSKFIWAGTGSAYVWTNGSTWLNGTMG
jgi:hypothetical protein